MTHKGNSELLSGIRVLSLAVNVPGPAAAARLIALGASVIKIEPPAGDPLEKYAPAWYRELVCGQEVRRLDLKNSEARASLDQVIVNADLLLTSSRPAAMQRLGFGWPELHAKFARLVQVAIVGYPFPNENVAGHDLTYQAALGLLDPPRLPRALVADLACAERAVSAALALLLARERTGSAGHTQVSLVESAAPFADPLRHGLTESGALLGGGFPGYNIYRARNGWIALASLEAHFWERLLQELHLANAGCDQLTEVFARQDGEHWEEWAKERDLPLVVVRPSSTI